MTWSLAPWALPSPPTGRQSRSPGPRARPPPTWPQGNGTGHAAAHRPTRGVEARDIARKLTPCRTSGKHLKDKTEPETTCALCWRDIAVLDGVIVEHGAPSGDYGEQLVARAAVFDEEIAYWKAPPGRSRALWGASSHCDTRSHALSGYVDRRP